MVVQRHTCRYHIFGCADSLADNYVSYQGRLAYEDISAESIFVHNQSMCQYRGCNDSAAVNFNTKVADAPAVPVQHAPSSFVLRLTSCSVLP